MQIALPIDPLRPGFLYDFFTLSSNGRSVHRGAASVRVASDTVVRARRFHRRQGSVRVPPIRLVDDTPDRRFFFFYNRIFIRSFSPPSFFLLIYRLHSVPPETRPARTIEEILRSGPRERFPVVFAARGRSPIRFNRCPRRAKDACRGVPSETRFKRNTCLGRRSECPSWNGQTGRVRVSQTDENRTNSTTGDRPRTSVLRTCRQNVCVEPNGGIGFVAGRRHIGRRLTYRFPSGMPNPPRPPRPVDILANRRSI